MFESIIITILASIRYTRILNLDKNNTAKENNMTTYEKFITERLNDKELPQANKDMIKEELKEKGYTVRFNFFTRTYSVAKAVELSSIGISKLKRRISEYTFGFDSEIAWSLKFAYYELNAQDSGIYKPELDDLKKYWYSQGLNVDA